MKKRYRVRANTISSTRAYHRGHWFYVVAPKIGDGTYWVHQDSGEKLYVSGHMGSPDQERHKASALQAFERKTRDYESEPSEDPVMIVAEEGGIPATYKGRAAPIRVYRDGRVFDDILAEWRSRECPYEGFNPAYRECLSGERLDEFIKPAFR